MSSERRRLVEQQERRLLRERAREHRSLLLAAGERRERPLGKLAEVEPVERLLGGVEVARALGGERADVRRAAEQHVLADAHPRRQQRRLRDEREPPSELAPGQLRDLVAVEDDRAAVSDEPRDRAQERALAGAVRADQRDPLARRDLGVDPSRTSVRPSSTETPPRVNLLT